MKHTVRIFLKYLVFLLVLFSVERIIFILFQLGAVKEIPLGETLNLFPRGFSMDVSTSCAILLIPFILFCIYIFSQRQIILRLVKYYIIIIIVATGFINICDIALYQAWGTRINQKAISYLDYPKEVLGGSLSFQYVFLFFIFILLCIGFILLHKKYFSAPVPVTGKLFPKILFIILMPFILIIGIRGGFQKFPMDKTWVYYSSHSVLNQTALNGSWNLSKTLLEPAQLKSNPYNYLSAAEAKQLMNEILAVNSDSVTKVLNTKRPNIVLIMLESWSTDVIEALDGRTGVTPEFAELSKEGLLFTNFYSPGFRTEQGLVALVSGFPSQPVTTIMRQFGKFERLPGLSRTLDSAGYSSSYYYGGNLHFAYTESYLRAMGFDKLYGENDIDYKRRAGWGIYDEEVFAFFNADMKETTQPFFSIIMSSTSHEPFDAEVEKIVPSKIGDWCNDYINTVRYSDKCLGDLIKGMKKQSWYNNTLIAITADHGNACPEKREYNSSALHHIPFLLTGGALREEFKGKTNDRFASQIDFPATVLAMLHLNHEHFNRSRNLFDGSENSNVFYSFDDGFGLLNEKQQLVYDNKLKRVIFLKNDSLAEDENTKYLNYGKAYLQTLMDEYIGVNEK
ncbi:MAG: sulfatase-like hydrolase/transferase [Bacteroidia bacterium]|nr:sulfatase-like hydrolase/transferase [Bacteroidia bacterium]